MKHLILFVCFAVLLSACGTGKRGPRTPERVILVDFKIDTRNNPNLNFINLDYYKLRVLDRLENFQNVQFTLAQPDETPEMTINLTIDNFVLWPRDERFSRRNVSRTIQTGKDSNGKPIVETVRATVDIIQLQRRSSARFIAELKYKDSPSATFKRSFSNNYNYNNTYVDNIRGDSRAVDPRLYFSRNPGIEPQEIDFLLQLSSETIQRMATELRTYYSKK